MTTGRRRLLTRISLNSRVEGTVDRQQVESAVAADPGDLEARYQLSTLQVLAGEYEEAMEQLLEVLKRDRAFRDDAGRKGLIEVFNLLGNSGPLVKRYRRMMASAMHWMASLLEVVIADHVAHLTFNRPERRNAFNNELMHEALRPNGGAGPGQFRTRDHCQRRW